MDEVSHSGPNKTGGVYLGVNWIYKLSSLTSQTAKSYLPGPVTDNPRCYPHRRQSCPHELVQASNVNKLLLLSATAIAETAPQEYASSRLDDLFSC
ncbi:plexin-A1 isoform X1 [Lates japonicus]|uniref:Plexin-A1 isoform X1 n=1 Tax=Lates japonicus TaxID=270547 RepID=A0AAD3M801_LATJO|nr:plexin-A1 isoform X1 [Lates japonicus]